MKLTEKLRAGQSIKIAFFGDSVTQGCFERYDPADVQYVYHTRVCNMLREKYPQAAIEGVNAGVAGNTSGMGLYRMQADVLDKKPDFCVVCFGINDTSLCALNRLTLLLPFARKLLNTMGAAMDPTALSLLKSGKGQEAYRYSMDQILTLLEESRIPAIVMTPNRMSLTAMEDKKSPNHFLSAINAKLVRNGTMDKMINIARETAKVHGVPVADCYAHWKQLEREGVVTSASYVNGTNHPSRELHQELANVLFSALEGV